MLQIQIGIAVIFWDAECQVTMMIKGFFNKNTSLVSSQISITLNTQNSSNQRTAPNIAEFFKAQIREEDRPANEDGRNFVNSHIQQNR